MAENDVDQSPTLSLIHDRICVVHLGPVYFLIHGGPDLVDICHVNLNKMATNFVIKWHVDLSEMSSNMVEKKLQTWRYVIF